VKRDDLQMDDSNWAAWNARFRGDEFLRFAYNITMVVGFAGGD
jgi:hypothetical protein